MVRLVGEASCSRAARALVLAGKLVVADAELPVVPDASWKAPSLPPVGTVPGEATYQASHAVA
eukprot:2536678-Alexandrium_andersonii.AAC.1